MRTVAIAFLLGLLGCSPSKPELHVFNWADYVAPDTLKNFEKEFDCRVVPDYFESAETLRTRLDNGRSGFDVVFPSDEVMRTFVAKGLLEKLDLSKLPNFKNIGPKFRGLDFDPKNEYSVPYMWGTTGLAYNKSTTPARRSPRQSGPRAAIRMPCPRTRSTRRRRSSAPSR
jgi:spermidine/putrescine transport system substrate-binding protein